MVKPGDIIQLPYTPDLTSAGVAYVRQLLSHTTGHDPGHSQQTLRQMVVDKAAELAFRRYLDEQKVPFATAPGTAFGSQTSFHLILGGWRCNIHSYWIDTPEIVSQVSAHPECLLDAAALLPSERIVAWIPGEKDLYIFAYVIGQTQKDNADMHHPSLANEQERKINPPSAWLEASLHGKAIYLGGYCTHPDYSRRSRRLTPGRRIFPPAPTQKQTRILYVRELHAIGELLSG